MTNTMAGSAQAVSAVAYRLQHFDFENILFSDVVISNGNLRDNARCDVFTLSDLKCDMYDVAHMSFS